MILELPVRSDIPSFDFKQELEGTVYTLKFRWNDRMATWIFSIADETGEDLIAGLPVQANVDIKGRFRQTNIPPGLFLCYDNTGKARNPDRDTFGGDVKFYYQEANG